MLVDRVVDYYCLKIHDFDEDYDEGTNNVAAVVASQQCLSSFLHILFDCDDYLELLLLLMSKLTNWNLEQRRDLATDFVVAVAAVFVDDASYKGNSVYYFDSAAAADDDELPWLPAQQSALESMVHHHHAQLRPSEMQQYSNQCRNSSIHASFGRVGQVYLLSHPDKYISYPIY